MHGHIAGGGQLPPPVLAAIGAVGRRSAPVMPDHHRPRPVIVRVEQRIVDDERHRVAVSTVVHELAPDLTDVVDALGNVGAGRWIGRVADADLPAGAAGTGGSENVKPGGEGEQDRDRQDASHRPITPAVR